MSEKNKVEDLSFSKHLQPLKTIKNSQSYSQTNFTKIGSVCTLFVGRLSSFPLKNAAEIGEITLYYPSGKH